VADARRLAAVVVVGALAVQAAFAAWVPREWAAQHAIGAPPDAHVAAIASLGETRGAAAALALMLQGFDTQAGEQQRLRDLDHADTVAWLARIGELAPGSGYDTFLATRIYADVVPHAARRPLLDWVRARFEQAPAAHWVSLAHATWIAAHPLADKGFAAELARSLREHAPADAPSWARQMEVLLRADLGEVDAARALFSAMAESGAIGDEREQQLLVQRLHEAERRAQPDGRPRPESASER
jgi:hypothetical protein